MLSQSESNVNLFLNKKAAISGRLLLMCSYRASAVNDAVWLAMIKSRLMTAVSSRQYPRPAATACSSKSTS